MRHFVGYIGGVYFNTLAMTEAMDKACDNFIAQMSDEEKAGYIQRCQDLEETVETPINSAHTSMKATYFSI